MKIHSLVGLTILRCSRISLYIKKSFNHTLKSQHHSIGKYEWSSKVIVAIRSKWYSARLDMLIMRQSQLSRPETSHSILPKLHTNDIKYLETQTA
jgi:hypothetical protein